MTLCFLSLEAGFVAGEVWCSGDCCQLCRTGAETAPSQADMRGTIHNSV